MIVLGTFDPILGVTKDDKKMPAIIKFYDFTKGGTDIVDQRIGNYSTKSKTKKWIKVVFFYTLDTTRNNALTIYCLNMGIIPRSYDSYVFGMDLVKGLITPFIESRSLEGLRRDIQSKMSLALGRDVNPQTQTPTQSMINFENSGAKRRCHMCKKEVPQTQGRKKACENVVAVKQQCQKCGNPTCNSHAIVLCKNCGSLYTLRKQE